MINGAHPNPVQVKTLNNLTERLHSLLRKLLQCCDVDIENFAKIINLPLLQQQEYEQTILAQALTDILPSNKHEYAIQQIAEYFSIKNEYATHIAGQNFSKPRNIHDDVFEQTKKIAQTWHEQLSKIHARARHEANAILRLLNNNSDAYNELFLDELHRRTQQSSEQLIAFLAPFKVILDDAQAQKIIECLKSLHVIQTDFRTFCEGIYQEPSRELMQFIQGHGIDLFMCVKGLEKNPEFQKKKLLRLVDYDFEQAVTLLSAFQSNPLYQQTITSLKAELSDQAKIIEAAQAVGQCLLNEFPGHPEFAKKVTSRFDRSLERTLSLLRELHVVSEHYQVILKIAHQVNGLFSDLTAFNSAIGRAARTPLQDIVNIINEEIDKATKRSQTKLPEGQDWTEADLSHQNLTTVSLNELNATKSNAQNSLVIGKEIIDSNFSGSNFKSANLVSCRIGHPQDADKYTQFREVNFDEARFCDSTFYCAEFIGSHCCGTDFSGIIAYPGVDFSEMIICDHTRFDDAKLDRVVMKNIRHDKSDTPMTAEQTKDWLERMKATGTFCIDDITHSLAKLEVTPKEMQRRRLSVKERSQKFQKMIDTNTALKAGASGEDNKETPAAFEPKTFTPQMGRKKDEGKKSGFFRSLFKKEEKTSCDIDWVGYSQRKLNIDLTDAHFSFNNDTLQQSFLALRQQYLDLSSLLKAYKFNKLDKQLEEFAQKPTLSGSSKLQDQLKRKAQTLHHEAFMRLAQDYEKFVRLHKAEMEKTTEPPSQELKSPRRRTNTLY